MSTQKVYDAEHEVEWQLRQGGTVDFFGSHLVLPPLRNFGDLNGVRRYLESVCEFEPVRDTWTRAYVVPRVKPTPRARKRAWYSYSDKTIYLPDHDGSISSWAMDEITVLHELAHHLVPSAGHGQVFTGCMVDLVKKVVGQEAGLLLFAALDSRGIGVQAPKAVVR